MSKQDRPQESSRVILGPCATRFRSAGELMARLVPARSVPIALTDEERRVLLRLGSLMYSSWELAWKAEMDCGLTPEQLQATVDRLSLMGLAEDLGDKLNLSEAGCVAWADLDAAGGREFRLPMALDADEAALLDALQAAGAAGLPLAPEMDRRPHAVRRLLALRLARPTADERRLLAGSTEAR